MDNISFLLSSSPSSLSTLQNLNRKPFRVSSLHHNNNSASPNSPQKISYGLRRKRSQGEFDNVVNFASAIDVLSKKKRPDLAEKLLVEIKSEGYVPSCATLSALMLCYVDNGLVSHAHAVWEEIINSSFVPSIEVVADLIDAYGNLGCYGEVLRILRDVTLRNLNSCSQVYSLVISCFGKRGQLVMMETVMNEMVLGGFRVNSVTGNAIIKYYAEYGCLVEMETAYGRLKRSRILLEKEGIRAMASAYIKEKKFYKLGEFLRDVGLGRRNVGNLLWNLLLLSYAGNFKMKSLQREFLSMLEAGFSPDLDTFNIRAIAFSRMSLFWDLHLSLEHMKHEKIVPDIVTYGCVVDAFLDRKLARNLDFALSKMNLDSSPSISTDPLVFEVFGKGDFHSSSEILLESMWKEKWTYRKLVAIYVKKMYRSNQIFWNY
ncbi:hypothetical protein MKW94_001050 [Papaver nudicaule]|uniref:Pentatricopeptide repeat-containing protein n=1 Tax=Papaver nudicaule TaxID=74823 RepID=A0AA41S1C5_PAPNU|nr:hypothetical protein [Papaver nudicaule]